MQYIYKNVYILLYYKIRLVINFNTHTQVRIFNHKHV